jgi:hypothetical protein
MTLKKIEHYVDLEQLPVGSVIQFDHDISSTSCVNTGVTTYAREKDGWVVLDDTGDRSFVGYGPIPTPGFSLDYLLGDHFSLVTDGEDEEEDDAA